MSWKFVFNPKAANGLEGQNEIAQQKAKAAGYKFYMWNNFVHFTSDGESTGISNDEMF